jgi:DNA helicase-2/ATP-dependent DNA helicase PcrA
MDNIYKGLNDKQKQAVATENKRALVIAGAGSGKTTVLTRKIAHIINSGVSAQNIFAVTFTNKAAKEMKERVEKLFNKNTVDGIWIGTFHSLFNKILRKHAHLVGVETNYEIIDDEDQKKILRIVIDEDLKLFQEYEKKERTAQIKEAVLQAMIYISNKKDNGLQPDDCEWTLLDSNKYCTNLLAVYFKYEERLRDINAVDFGDLILYPYIIFRDNKSVLEVYQNNFKHVLVDEFQDTNFTQYELVKMLSKKGSLFVVGDDDQSIYEWRNANVENIIDFDKEFKSADIIKLEQNYRSTSNILNGANGLIDKNKKRRGKNLWSDKGDGDKIQVLLTNSPYDEADYIASYIKEEIRKGKKASDFAILYRINALSRTMEMKLNDYRVPYKIIGGLAFWARSEIKDMLAYLSIVDNPNNFLAFERIINVPTRGIGEKTFQKIRNYAEEHSINFKDALKDFVEKSLLPKKSLEAVSEFYSLINELYVLKSNNVTIKEYIEYIIENTTIIDFYKEDGADKGDERIANVMELIAASENFQNENLSSSVQDFVNFAMLQTTFDKNDNGDYVQLMTVHTAKGLEFDTVFVIGMEMDIFPSSRSIKENKIEEERRLAYVALTRAKSKLFLSNTIFRFPNKDFGISFFIDEVPDEYKTVIDKRKNNNFNQNYFKNNQNEKQVKSMALDNIQAGKTINHKKYGSGKILSVVRDGGYYLITVNFDNFGKKTIMYTP